MKTAVAVISKMSVKAMGCNPRIAANKDEGDYTPVDLAIIFGSADGIKSGEGADGKVWTALTGNFEGTVIQEGNRKGKTFQSGKLFLPGGIQEVVENTIKAAQIDSKGAIVEFGLQISAIKASNPIGYSYQAIQLLKPVEADPMEALRKVVNQGAIELTGQPLLALEAGTTVDTTIAQEPVPEPEPAPLAQAASVPHSEHRKKK